MPHGPEAIPPRHGQFQLILPSFKIKPVIEKKCNQYLAGVKKKKKLKIELYVHILHSGIVVKNDDNDFSKVHQNSVGQI